MPFALVVIGLLMIVTGAQNTHAQFGAQVRKDFEGGPNCNPFQRQFSGCGFVWWIVAIVTIGSIGYIDRARPFSHAFLVLLVVAMILANGGFFSQLTQALQAGPAQIPRSPDQPNGSGSTNQDGTASQLGSFAAPKVPELTGSGAPKAGWLSGFFQFYGINPPALLKGM